MFPGRQAAHQHAMQPCSERTGYLAVTSWREQRVQVAPQANTHSPSGAPIINLGSSSHRKQRVVLHGFVQELYSSREKNSANPSTYEAKTEFYYYLHSLKNPLVFLKNMFNLDQKSILKKHKQKKETVLEH